MNPEAAAWTTETGWRLMFVSEAVLAGLFALLVLLVPETPRYLAMCGKDEKALNVLSRINGSSQAKVILADIKATTEEKTEKTLLRLDGYLYRYHVERIPAGCRYQCGALFCAAYI